MIKFKTILWGETGAHGAPCGKNRVRKAYATVPLNCFTSFNSGNRYVCIRDEQMLLTENTYFFQLLTFKSVYFQLMETNPNFW